VSHNINNHYKQSIILGYLKAGEGNPQAREEEGKLSLLSMERCSSPAGIPGIWGSEFHGKAATFAESTIIIHSCTNIIT